MPDRHSYSQYLYCLYDETEPTGYLGRGTHYSVFRTPTWYDEVGQPRSTGGIHDLAVIWDEDHDIRIIKVLEHLYFKGLLHPIIFVGERKGTITFVFSENSDQWRRAHDIDDYINAVAGEAVVELLGDQWNCEFGIFEYNTMPRDTTLGTYHLSLISDHKEKVQTYLQNIHNLWKLGHKQFR